MPTILPTILPDSKARLILILNLVAFLLHLGLAIATGIIGNLDLSPAVYETRNKLIYNSSSTGFTLEPQYRKSGGGFPVTILTLVFFVVTSSFHLGNATFLAATYFGGLEVCTTPTRWLEYFITASLMMAIIAFLSGLRDVMTLSLVSGLIAATMLFGFMSELVNRPLSASRWNIESVWHRLVPHFAGYVPYAFAWTAVILSFLDSICAAPSWVIAIIFAQLGLFTSFVGPQIYQIVQPPSKFYRGEIGFIILSFISKSVLGILLLAGGMSQEEFDDFKGFDDTDCNIYDEA